MVVNSYNVEFGYELLSAIPYAYNAYKHGTLRRTVSGKQSEPLYYFSPRHKINPERRSFSNIKKAAANGVPNTFIHTPERFGFTPPDYKGHFANEEYKWDKPTLCICNRANIEWGHSMINFFSKDILDWMFENLKDHYEIVYFPAVIPEEIQDHEKPINIGDIEVAKRHGVRVFSEMVKDNWNETMLRIFANCEHYITMNGGYSIMASFFSGTNIIYSKPGQIETKEIKVGSFWRWYPNINNVRTLHAASYDELKERITALYIDKLPVANVIIRTSNRPLAFLRCIESVINQDYPNINIVVVCDDHKSMPYTRGFKVRVIYPDPVMYEQSPEGESYGKWFPANDYLTQVQKKVDGFMLIMDDDNMYLHEKAISKIMAVSKKDSLTVCKTVIGDKGIPSYSFGVKPTLYDIDSACMCYHSSMETDWGKWKRGDYRTAAKFEKVIWLDELLSKTQGLPGMGNRKDVIIYNFDMLKMKKKQKVKVKFRRQFREYGQFQVVELDWIEAMYYLRREVADLVEEEQTKEQIPVLEDKELKPKRKTKKR